MRFTKRLWRLHSWCGLVAGLGLLVIGLSGSILVFRAEVDVLLNPAARHFAPPREAARLSFDELFAKVRAQSPGQEVAGWTVSADRSQPDDVAVARIGDADGKWRWLKVDPTTGNVLGETSANGRTFTEWLLDLHDSFLAGDWGIVIAGIFAALLCVLGVSGAWLYRSFWRHFFRLRWRASARIFLSDLHKAVGISSVAFNLVLGFTGAWWNLPTLATVLGISKESAPPKKVAARFYNPALSIDALIAAARRAFPEMRSGRVYLNLPPRYDDISVRGPLPTRNLFRSDFGGEVTFDPETGALRKITDIRSQPLWTQIEDMMGPLHFGTFGGLPIKILWCLGGLAPGVLAVSGFLIWRRRARG